MAFPFGGKEPEKVVECWQYKFSNTSGTCSGFASGGVLGQLIVQGGTLGALTIYDNTAASGTMIANITAPSGGQQFWFNAIVYKGISVFASAATNYTVTYMK